MENYQEGVGGGKKKKKRGGRTSSRLDGVGKKKSGSPSRWTRQKKRTHAWGGRATEEMRGSEKKRGEWEGQRGEKGTRGEIRMRPGKKKRTKGVQSGGGKKKIREVGCREERKSGKKKAAPADTRSGGEKKCEKKIEKGWWEKRWLDKTPLGGCVEQKAIRERRSEKERTKRNRQ